MGDLPDLPAASLASSSRIEGDSSGKEVHDERIIAGL